MDTSVSKFITGMLGKTLVHAAQILRAVLVAVCSAGFISTYSARILIAMKLSTAVVYTQKMSRQYFVPFLLGKLTSCSYSQLNNTLENYFRKKTIYSVRCFEVTL